MSYNLENLKTRSRQISTETRKGANTSDRIGNLFFDFADEIGNTRRLFQKRSFIISFISITISLFALILSFCKSDDITVNGANMLGVTVGVLAFLVTLLIGFQIYKAIEVEETIEKKMSAIEIRMLNVISTEIDTKIETLETRMRDLLAADTAEIDNKIQDQLRELLKNALKENNK